MAPGVREQMIDAAIVLLAQKGLPGTSFSEVLERSGAPRGSVYHHFPGGKDELVAAAVEQAGDRAIAALEATGPTTVVAVAEGFLDLWRQLLVYSSYGAGCSVLAVTVATDSADLLARTGTVFRGWRRSLATLAERAGVAEDAAAAFAATLIAASEGAVVLSRAEQSADAFELVAGSLVAQARLLDEGTGGGGGL